MRGSGFFRLTLRQIATKFRFSRGIGPAEPRRLTMSRISAELHNRLNDKFAELKAENPHITMRPTQAEAAARSPADIG